jgi:hypothetical protein
MNIFPNKHYHITKKNLGDEVTLKPSGDFEPEGVSFAPSIEQAINAIPLYFTGEDNFNKDEAQYKKGVVRKTTFYVYTPSEEYKAIIPKTVDDIELSDERRVLGNVTSKKIGKISVESSESPKGRNIHGIKYRWIEKKNKSDKMSLSQAEKRAKPIPKIKKSKKKSTKKMFGNGFYLGRKLPNNSIKINI